MSRHIVVTYSIPLPDDFEATVKIANAYGPIHDELGKRLSELGVKLQTPRITHEGTAKPKGKPGRKPGKIAEVSTPFSTAA